MKSIILAVVLLGNVLNVIAAAKSKEVIIIDQAAIIERTYSMPVKKCTHLEHGNMVVNDDKYPIGGYRCEAAQGDEVATIYQLRDGSIEHPKEIIELCTTKDNKKKCQTVFGDMPETRIENLIDHHVNEVTDLREATRSAFMYKKGYNYLESPEVINQYSRAIVACEKQPDVNNTKTFTWAGRIKSDGRFTFGTVEPKTLFIQCVNEQFPKPPIADYDRHGGYPLYFNFPYGDFDGGSTQGLERKPEEALWIKK
jgi:hypothetical protein